MADNTKEIANVQETATNATAAETAGKAQPERKFTQAEVNQIVAERLNRERAKAAPDGAAEPSEEDTRAKELDARAKEIAARESAFECREYIKEKGYPEKLLEIFPTDDKEAFTKIVDTLVKEFPQIFSTGWTVELSDADKAAGVRTVRTGDSLNGIDTCDSKQEMIDRGFARRMF